MYFGVAKLCELVIVLKFVVASVSPGTNPALMGFVVVGDCDRRIRETVVERFNAIVLFI